MTDSQKIGFATMSQQLKNATRYHQWLFDLIKNELGDVVLECGTGNGIMTKHLLSSQAKYIYSVDIDNKCLDNLKKQIKSPKLILVQHDLNSLDFVNSFRNKKIDTIVIFNVLEHIEHDVKLLRNLKSILTPKGKILLFIPAFKLLFGGMDKTAGHFRRYSRQDILKKFKIAKLQPKNIDYVNPLGFFGWLITNKILNVSNLNDFKVNKQIAIFDKYLLPISQFLQILTKKIIGQSIFAIGVKN